MGTISRISFWSALAVSIGSMKAAAMMGFEGPPPCESQTCFVDAVAACKADAHYITSTAAGAKAQYMIEGSTEDGRCRLGMIYMQHPDADRTYKPLHFVVDPDGDIETQLKKAVEACLSGRGGGDHQCAGPLLEVSGEAGK